MPLNKAAIAAVTDAARQNPRLFDSLECTLCKVDGWNRAYEVDGIVSSSSHVRRSSADSRESAHMSSCGRNDAQTAGRSGNPNSLQRS
jgi:hypothetical protein